MEHAGPGSLFEESPPGSVQNTGCGKHMVWKVRGQMDNT